MQTKYILLPDSCEKVDRREGDVSLCAKLGRCVSKSNVGGLHDEKNHKTTEIEVCEQNTLATCLWSPRPPPEASAVGSTNRPSCDRSTNRSSCDRVPQEAYFQKQGTEATGGNSK